MGKPRPTWTDPLSQRSRLLLIAGLSIFFSFALLAARVLYTGTGSYVFLVWNLFLAALPMFFSTLLVAFRALRRCRLTLPGILGAWLLLFPNAPYIVTDLLHLRYGSGAPPWYDLILLVSFSWSGLLLGFLSLADVQEILRRRFGWLAAGAFAAAALTSAAFGIYLGRFLRWNSWDLLTNPFSLLADVAHRVLDPMSHPTAVVVTLLLSVLLSLWYLAFRAVAPAAPRTDPGASGLERAVSQPRARNIAR